MSVKLLKSVYKTTWQINLLASYMLIKVMAPVIHIIYQLPAVRKSFQIDQ